jgi:hypothetical protein
MRCTPTAALALLLIAGVGMSQSGDAAMNDDAPARFAPEFDMNSVNMQAQIETMTPTDRHEMLDYFVGDWDVQMRVWGGNPGGQPQESEGTASFEKILGGRFLEGRSTAPVMGRPMETRSLLGFDIHNNHYDLTMLNSMSTAILSAEGHAAMDGSYIQFFGDMDEPALGLHGRMVRYVWRVKDANRFTIEVYDPHIAETNNKVVEIRHQRRN